MNLTEYIIELQLDAREDALLARRAYESGAPEHEIIHLQHLSERSSRTARAAAGVEEWVLITRTEHDQRSRT